MNKDFISPVDCVAYSAIDVLQKSIVDTPHDEPNPKVGEVNATCYHPARGGPVFGCLLVDFDTGKLIPDATCSFVAPDGSSQAIELEKIFEEKRDDIPF